MFKIIQNAVPFYTSYFGNIRKILKEDPDAGLVSIAGKTPSWFKEHKFKKLAPHYEWWKEWHDTFNDNLESKESKKWYTDKYFSTVLRNLDPYSIAKKLKDLVGYKTVFLLCYETPEKFCHRHIVAEWLNNAGVDCREFC